jgi:hypothetical protein
MCGTAVGWRSLKSLLVTFMPCCVPVGLTLKNCTFCPPSVCFWCDYQNKQPLFLYTALNCWLLRTVCVYCAIRVQSWHLGGDRVRSQASQCEIVVDRVTLRVFFEYFSFPVNIIPPMLHIHLYLPTALTRTNGWSLRRFTKKCCCLGNRGAVDKKNSTTPRRTDWPSVVRWIRLDLILKGLLRHH